MQRLASLRSARLLAASSHRITIPTRACATSEDALRAALSRVADSIKARDPQSQPLPAGDEVPGVRTAGPKLLLQFTCTHSECEGGPTTKMISKGSYENGIVVVRCDSCDRQHLISDRLGWFGQQTDIEQILEARGEQVRRAIDDDLLHME